MFLGRLYLTFPYPCTYKQDGRENVHRIRGSDEWRRLGRSPIGRLKEKHGSMHYRETLGLRVITIRPKTTNLEYDPPRVDIQAGQIGN